MRYCWLSAALFIAVFSIELSLLALSFDIEMSDELIRILVLWVWWSRYMKIPTPRYHQQIPPTQYQYLLAGEQHSTAIMTDGLVTDPDLLPAWAKPGEQIYRWTDDKWEIYFVPATVFQQLTKPWRGQNNMTRSAVNPATKSVQELCKDKPVLNITSRFQGRCP